MGYRLTQEGHNVTMWIQDPLFTKVGNGFVKKTENWLPLKKESQLIIFDDCGMGEASETLKKEGYTVWGGNKWSDEIEEDRKKGQDLFKSVGMETATSKTFKSIEDGIRFVQSKPSRYVVKPDGYISQEKSLTYVGKEENGSDLIAILQNYKSKWGSQIESFELQEVKNGVEVAIGGFFNGKDFMEPILVNFEHKKLFPGNIGPATGEMGTGGVYMPKNRIYQESLGRCVQKLRENKYVGYFDINCIAEAQNLWPLEVTSRFGYPTIELFLCSIRKNLGDLMFKIAKGEATTLNITKPYCVCVVIASPPFPFTSEQLHSKYSDGQEVIFKNSDRIGFWPGQVLLEEKKWFVTGRDGYNVIVTGTGKNIEEARRKAYERVNNVTLANSFYRTDIALKNGNDLNVLNKWGWLK